MRRVPLVYCNQGGRSFRVLYDEARGKYAADEVEHGVVQPLPDVYPCMADYYVDPRGLDFTRVLSACVGRGICKVCLDLECVVSTYLNLFGDPSVKFSPRCSPRNYTSVSSLENLLVTILQQMFDCLAQGPVEVVVLLRPETYGRLDGRIRIPASVVVRALTEKLIQHLTALPCSDVADPALNFAVSRAQLEHAEWLQHYAENYTRTITWFEELVFGRSDFPAAFGSIFSE